jgi:DNA-directed RNA polymerase specialized sigma subunit
MNNFTNFTNFTTINEAVSRTSTDVLSVADINKYIQAVSKQIPSQVANVIYITAKYKLCDQKSIDDIKSCNKGQLSKISAKYDMPMPELEDLWETLKSLKNNIRLLPQYQTASERNAFMAGKLNMSDIAIDLDSSAGRNACAKQYMSMVHKIVNGYVGQSKLSKPELMSAALQGFTDAMNDWRKNDIDNNSVPFKTYAAYRVKQQILNDINSLSYTVSTNWYGVQKMGAGMLSAISIDSMMGDDDNDFKQDRLGFLGEEPNYTLTNSEERNWNELYKLIEATFKQRDVDVFYRYFGLKGHNKEKAKDIAKSLGISPQLVTNIVKDVILKKLKNSSKAMEILSELQSSYNESLMFDIMALDKEMMVEAILSDDTFILLEELTKWSNKDVYINTINNALASLSKDEQKSIEKILKDDFDYLDTVFKSSKKIIIKFLNAVYPTESFSRKSDVSLLENMTELADLYKNYHK